MSLRWKSLTMFAAAMSLFALVGCGVNMANPETMKSSGTTSQGPSASVKSGLEAKPQTASFSKLIPAVVTKETDGDTIHVRLVNGADKTIRMLLIDTPEDKKPDTPVEPYSLDAAHYCATVLPVGKHIYVEEGVPGHQTDKYGRLLAFVYVTKTDMYNEDVVKKGLARVAYIYPPNTRHLSVLEKDQSYAKSHHLGIWTIPGYVTSHGYNMAAVKKSGWTTTHSSTSTSSASTSGIRVVAQTLSVAPRSHASVEVRVTPHAVGHIEVDYQSGPSHAKGLSDETADSHGDITWTWDVGSNTTRGDWPVIITVGKQTLRLSLHVR